MSKILMTFAPDVPLDAKTRKQVSKFWYQYLVAMRRAERFWPFWCNLTMKMYEKCSKSAR